jgi:hypothetical protein
MLLLRLRHVGGEEAAAPLGQQLLAEGVLALPQLLGRDFVPLEELDDDRRVAGRDDTRNY